MTTPIDTRRRTTHITYHSDSLSLLLGAGGLPLLITHAKKHAPKYTPTSLPRCAPLRSACSTAQTVGAIGRCTCAAERSAAERGLEVIYIYIYDVRPKKNDRLGGVLLFNFPWFVLWLTVRRMRVIHLNSCLLALHFIDLCTNGNGHATWYQ